MGAISSRSLVPCDSVRPLRRLAIPTVPAQLGDEFGRQRTLVAEADIRSNIFRFAHADNGSTDHRVREYEADGHLGQRHTGGHNLLEALNALNGRHEVFTREVTGTPVAFMKLRFHGHIAAEAAFVERNAGDDGDVQLAAYGEKLLSGCLVKDVVDDLHGIDEAAANSFDAIPRLPTVEAETKGADDAIALQPLEGIAEVGFVGPGVIPDVKLQQVDPARAEVLKN